MPPPAPESDLSELLRRLHPELHVGHYCFCLVSADVRLAGVNVVATFREAEGITVILPEPDALQLDLKPVFTAAWITLAVHSDLAAVGLTAAVSHALAAAGIPCNVVAAVHHDHLFVPPARAAHAMDILHALSRT